MHRKYCHVSENCAIITGYCKNVILSRQLIIPDETNLIIESNTFSGVVYFAQGKKYPILILDNFEFSIEHKYAQRTTWRCKYKGRRNCRARVQTFAKTLKIMQQNHSHEPTFEGDLSNMVKTIVNIEIKSDLSV
ncbi:hypothetical protein HHI36_012689 [Cryptolaemus montrouzieri]|uniref:FLYWCH-type domain-containing protein n=1 Tax=Cryptolaemus montrouzieri TaxID=559131 RepID=A0ABD2NEZ3_9CUCU